jgi:hypothetical protein
LKFYPIAGIRLERIVRIFQVQAKLDVYKAFEMMHHLVNVANLRMDAEKADLFAQVAEKL